MLAETGADPLIVEAEVDTALSSMLTSWGTTSADEQAWIETGTMRINDVILVIGNAPGVAAVTAVTLNGAGTDLVLAGPAALPAPLDDPTDPSTISGTVS